MVQVSGSGLPNGECSQITIVHKCHHCHKYQLSFAICGQLWHLRFLNNDGASLVSGYASCPSWKILSAFSRSMSNFCGAGLLSPSRREGRSTETRRFSKAPASCRPRSTPPAGFADSPLSEGANMTPHGVILPIPPPSERGDAPKGQGGVLRAARERLQVSGSGRSRGVLPVSRRMNCVKYEADENPRRKAMVLKAIRVLRM